MTTSKIFTYSTTTPTYYFRVTPAVCCLALALIDLLGLSLGERNVPVCTTVEFTPWRLLCAAG
jgi:hypothetical protein